MVQKIKKLPAHFFFGGGAVSANGEKVHIFLYLYCLLNFQYHQLLLNEFQSKNSGVKEIPRNLSDFVGKYQTVDKLSLKKVRKT